MLGRVASGPRGTGMTTVHSRWDGVRAVPLSALITLHAIVGWSGGALERRTAQSSVLNPSLT